MTPTDLARLAAEGRLDPEDQRRLVEACADDEELAAFVLAFRDVHALTGLAAAAAAASARRARAKHRTRVAVAAAAAFLALAVVGLGLRFLSRTPEVSLASIPLSEPPAVVRTQPPLEETTTAALAGWTPEPAGGTQWLTSLADAQAIAAATHRPVLLYVYHPTCPWCATMNRVTWPDARVSELTADVVPVKVNVEETTEEFQEQMKGWPWIVLEDPDGRILREFPGFREAEDMSSELKSGLESAHLETALPWPEARRLASALAAARDAEERGRLGEASSLYASLLSAPGAFAEEAREGERRIAESARRALLQAQRLAVTSPGEALARLDEAAETFRGTPHAADLERVREAIARTGRFPHLSVRGEVG